MASSMIFEPSTKPTDVP